MAISIFTTAQPPLRPLTENSHYQFSKPNEKMRLKNPFMTLSVHLVIIANLKFKKNYIQSNLAIRNFLVTLKLFLNAKSLLSLWSKWQIGHRKWFLDTLSNRSLLPSLTIRYIGTSKVRPLPIDRKFNFCHQFSKLLKKRNWCISSRLLSSLFC